MKLQYKCSGCIVVVPNGTAYDAAVFREIKETSLSDTLNECKAKADQTTSGDAEAKPKAKRKRK